MSGIVVERDGGVVRVVLDIPPVNALTLARYDELSEIFTDLGQDMAVHCAVLAARGTKAFCAGLDLKEFAAASVDTDAARAATVRRTFLALQTCDIPVIGAIGGPALGAGCGLAAMCDIRIASDRATFGLPEINVGRCGGGAFVGRLIPQGMMRMMFFTGEPIPASEALRVGLVEQVVRPRLLDRTVDDMARLIASKSPLGLRLGKKSLNESEFLPVHEGYMVEQRYSTMLMGTEDAREAARAAAEKRPAQFVGR
jgi:enoyl-CoA hydratase